MPKGVGFYPEQTLLPWHPARPRRKDGAQILCMDFPQTQGHTEVPERRGQRLFLDVELGAVSSVLGVSSEVSFGDSLTLMCIRREMADPLWASQFTLWLMGTPASATVSLCLLCGAE